MPRQIGRYRVTSRLGFGAFATVWLAEDDALKSSVAIKVLADNWAHHADIRARFEQEARIMRRADSDRLVRVLDIGELPDGRPYLVMTYAAGGTLAERLGAGPMRIHPALRTAADIARSVAVLHGIGVLHRDLKPSNVLFDGERVLVADLGLAKAIAQASGFTVVAGTPGYMAPEQARPGGGLDVRADVYAIGALAYHMLTGRAPGVGEHGAGSSGSGSALRPSKLRPGVPAHVDKVVLRALHRDPERRWPSASAFAEALDEAADRAPEPGGPVRTKDSAKAGRRIRSAGRMAVAASALAAVLTLADSSGPVGSTAPGWVRVSDASGDLTIAVPAGWAQQLKDAGWDPARVRLPSGQAPGLLVGPDLAAWPDPASRVPGVFAGASRSLGSGQPAPALPAHADCTAHPARPVAIGDLTGWVRRWVGCGGTPISFSEVLLAPAHDGYGIYVQIKQVDRTDRTDWILESLRVRGSLAPQATGRGR
ncbi:serine/threonine-protein kinase [Micromonospora musae]|uniref:non-specific serine/threonine protein kinase n=1 Tax=Micromonospora musae TaxID=1894970 RepID=A0A3A9Y2D4_9ACTN|nr:serine/threonine-protein kinase [Micromonospora musae]RKN31558.1 serine/threonine protein kinase [Micromonospora musae]